MWIQVLFDLPVMTKKERKAATGFRNYLMGEGFEMAQYSVYQRFCVSREKADVYVKKVMEHLPDTGLIHILLITDKQYKCMLTFTGKKRGKPQTNPNQLALF